MLRGGERVFLKKGMGLKIPEEGWVAVDDPGEGGRGKNGRAEKAILKKSVFILKLMRSHVVVSIGD